MRCRLSATAKRPLIMGLCGAQGSGKSTLSDSLAARLRVTGVRAASVSIHQRVMRGTLVLAEAEVVAALVAPSGRPRRQPRDWIDRFDALVDKGDKRP